MSDRQLLAALQRRYPGCLARLIDDGEAEVACDDLADLPRVLADREPPLRLLVGTRRVLVASDPRDLVGGAGSTGAGELAGRVVLVSGAASGLGLGIARGCHAVGAMVVLTDVDEPGLEAALTAFDDPARVAATRIDVTDEDSVAAGFDAALGRFGRIDGLVCAAGVAPPYDLVDFPLAKFRLACEVNLVGYFLLGREAARVMVAQGHGGAMVLLSSKSGLEPSKANTAYNATKAGELHMARGWALELGRQGIRVNCIAPGNVFQGSKIWNPDYIAKAAQKKGIRPDEVIPYYNSLTALDAEIEPGDIANSAVFLLSDRARRMTGQVLVVDAGQVWTR